MNKILCGVLLIGFAQTASAECLFPKNDSDWKLIVNTKTDEIDRRGCCSHHNGVCGCSGGTAMCCDGSASPTCGC